MKKIISKIRFSCYTIFTGIALTIALTPHAIANKLNQTSLPRKIDQTEDCEILIVGGGVAGTAAAYVQKYQAQGERALLLYPQSLEVVAAFCGCLYGRKYLLF